MERTYTIPLRREWIKTVRYKRAKKTIRAIREFMMQHMKTDEVRIGPFLNEEVWKHGIANPPSRVRVNCVKDKDGVVTVELVGKPLGKASQKEEPKAKKTKEKATAKSETAAEETKERTDSKSTESKEQPNPDVAKKAKAPKKTPESPHTKDKPEEAAKPIDPKKPSSRASK